VSVKYDDFVKRPYEESEYTPEMIEELQKSSIDIWPFLKYIKVIHPDKGEIPFEPSLRKFQKEILETISENRFVISLCARQSGKSTGVSAYILWYAVFHANKMIGIVSNKQTSAIHILYIIRRMYESLPSWIKPGVKEYSKTFITFDNGTKIEVSATSTDAFRGRPLNLLFCDEFAFVRKGIAEEFWSANYPAISASKKSKVVIVSTPNGMFNLFHRLYSGAERKENMFIPLKYTWRAVPDRDEEWARQERKNLGDVMFTQEQECDFLGSTNTVIDTNVLGYLFQNIQNPLLLQLDNKLRIYEKPEKGSIYVLGCDVAKGTGEHYSTIQILKIIGLKPINLKQVAVFESNTTDIYSFSSIINRISLYYSNSYILVENNAEGSSVVDRLWWDFENGRLVNSGSKSKDLGIRATRSTKPKAVLYMKRVIEDNSLSIADTGTVNQLSSFVEKNGKFFGKDMPDDLVSGLYWACYVFTMKDILNDEVKLKDDNEDINDAWGILSDVVDDFEDEWEWLKDISLQG
jgi:hypothetical protein